MLNAKNASGGGAKREVLSPGSYPGRVAWIVGLGLQAQRPYQGEEKEPREEILVSYEFADEFMKDEEGNEVLDKPRMVSERFPLFNISADKAKSTKRYMSIDPDMVADGDWSKLGGNPVTITIVNNESKGKVYENVSAISPMRVKDVEKMPDMVNNVLVFDPTNPDMEVYEQLPSWIKDVIKAGLDYPGSVVQEAILDHEGEGE